MYAKSIIEHVRERLATGEWTQHVSFVPVVMALAVAVLPFTLDSRVDADAAASVIVDADNPVAETPASNNMVNTAANPTARAIQEERRHVLIADYMARKFLVSRQVVLDLVKTAHVVGRQYNVDPTLLVAVMSIESSFNPIAESVVGAKGLMQIIPHYHLEKFTEFGGEQAAFDPRVNIAVGAKIIREYLHAASGNLFTAMQTYGGALPDRDAAYTHKVLNEKDRLDTLLGQPKTDRSGYLAYSPTQVQPSAQPAAGGRVQMVIPAPGAPANAAPAIGEPGGASKEPAAKPAEPLAALPAKLAALRAD